MLGVSLSAASLVPPRTTSRSLMTDLRIMISLVDVGCFSRCHVFGAASGDALDHFVTGVGHFLANLGIDAALGASFAVVVVVTFAGTTMDTGVRLQRYILEEIAELAGFKALVGKTSLLTTLAVLIPLALALVPGGDSSGGKGFAFGQLWTLFGTTNQLTAGLALSVISVWILARNRNPLAAIVPLLAFMPVGRYIARFLPPPVFDKVILAVLAIIAARMVLRAFQ